MSPRKNKQKREKMLSKLMKSHKKGKSHSRPSHSTASRVKSRRSAETRYGGVLTGIFSYSGKGFGFCIPDEEYHTDDIFIPASDTMGAMTGDRVTVEYRQNRGEKNGKLEGRVTDVTYSCASIIGTLEIHKNYSVCIPQNKRLGVKIYIRENDAEFSGAHNGDKIEVTPAGEDFFVRERSLPIHFRHSEVYFDLMGEISSVFGPSLSKDANYSAILHSAGIRTEFPPSVLAHADSVSREDPSDDFTGLHRADLRDKIIFTIDGAGAKDLDDAISLEVEEENGDKKYILGVHIADVSHYVRAGTPTDDEARLRGTSVYFTDKVVPMLPESLSNGACSLGAGEDKLALSAEITISASGERLSTRISKSVIRSSVRGVYSEVNDIFDKGEASEYFRKYSKVYGTLTDMKELYEILAKRSHKKGVLELDDREASVVLDSDGNPVEIVARVRGVGEKLIEQFMLQANNGVAETLSSLYLPCLYRIHERPDEEKLRSFAVYINNIGLSSHGIISSAEEEMPESVLMHKLGLIMSEARDKGIGEIVSSVLLRSMMKAKYQSEKASHFGLGEKTYCHFTSPIRRYPDLFVHSVITAALEGSGEEEITVNSPSEVLMQSVKRHTEEASELGILTSDCEVRAQNAERDITDLYMTLYMSEKIGEEFEVTVSSVIRSGMFVTTDFLVEGFIPAVFMKNVKINEELYTLFSDGVKYTLGTRLKAKLIEADVSTSRITFEPIFDGKSL